MWQHDASLAAPWQYPWPQGANLAFLDARVPAVNSEARGLAAMTRTGATVQGTEWGREALAHGEGIGMSRQVSQLLPPEDQSHAYPSSPAIAVPQANVMQGPDASHASLERPPGLDPQFAGTVHSNNLDELLALVDRHFHVFTAWEVIVAMRALAPGTPGHYMLRQRGYDPAFVNLAVARLTRRLEQVMGGGSRPHPLSTEKMDEALITEMAVVLSRHALFDTAAYVFMLRHARAAGDTVPRNEQVRVHLLEGLAVAAMAAENSGYHAAARMTNGVLETLGTRGYKGRSGFLCEKDLREQWSMAAPLFAP
eukprot:gnl/TRDRNA2_/TRDRNA2_160791_c0_seq1.p1 gnl/TRDRNA2_/TRDRNA2_160791_c0~~gnl/TRDRNA2_/TRDRNA2_160791_c0_seq1.p1  ORF type:complete len:310 (-),score=39.88 gnl/TRDRNA2_/TRDRNA2_160791_c0_seq1:2-931(-)